MKKTLLLTIALLLSVATFAQDRSIILRETFDSTTMPSGWSTSDNSTDNWGISETNRAGGEANELKLSPNPQAVGFIRVITKSVDLTGLDKVTVSFRHYFQKKSMSAVIGIATSSNNGTTWSSAWTKTYSEEGVYSIVEEISTPDMGKNNVKFCIYYQGNTTNINAWYFDDFEVVVTENTDAKLESIDTPTFIAAGKNDITFTVQNNGLDNITSFEATYKINDVEVSETFTSDFAQFERQQFTFNEKAYLIPGDYNVEIEINSVNDTQDQNLTNNISNKDLTVALGGVRRIAMIEHFSSSTCASCMPLNLVMKELTDNNPGKFTYTKYVMNFPAQGDDYYTAEAGVRKNYYNVSGVPTMVLNGRDHTYLAVTQEEIDENYNSIAFVDIRGAFKLDGNNININIDVMPYTDLNNKRLFVTVNEKTTVENVEVVNGSNSEFHHIMMKMITGSQGETINLTEGTQQHFEYSYDMSTTFVEEINDLEVAVWIQDYETKEVYNSRFLYEYTEHPYPVENLTLNNINNDIEATWEAPSNGNPTGYNVFVNGDLTLENTSATSYTVENAEGYCSVEVVALYENDKESVGVIATQGLSVTDDKEMNITIYPNPAKDYVKVSTDNGQQTTVRIYNVMGMLVGMRLATSATNEIEINVSDYNPGIYFFNIQTENGSVTKKIIVE